VNNSFGVKFSTVSVGRTQNNDQIIFPVLLDDTLNILLTIQVKGTGRRSNKTLRLNQYRFSPRTLHTRLNSGTLHAIPFTNDDDFLPL
jgi:hypothetical protein